MADSPFRVVTVCTGNICRSPMAERLLRRALQEAAASSAEDAILSEVAVDSAGISDEEAGRSMDHRAEAQLRSMEIDPSGHVAREWDSAWFRERDLILAMDVNHHRALLRWAPDDEARAKVRMFRSFDPAVEGKEIGAQGIYDPWYGDAADFVECATMISAALDPLVDFIRTAVARGAQHGQ
ncbi:low molecular weight protein-tyrosine-phosphatase [Arthrobacter sp. NPDC090010]|uniref:low molecular weight protein-tyrosine-phosphatase n=1 Tax=Arthrobacter sp. NPDC090010 TaxID=3363942 RepID=UPI0037F40C6C